MIPLELLAIGVFLIGITFGIHAVGSTRLLEFLSRKYAGRDGEWRHGKSTLVLIVTGVSLLLLHMVEASTWAIAYWLLPETHQLSTFQDAMYFSVVTFTTLGYGDITLDAPWRALAGFEAMSGILLAGWSTALLFTVVQRSWKLTHGQSD